MGTHKADFNCHRRFSIHLVLVSGNFVNYFNASNKVENRGSRQANFVSSYFIIYFNVIQLLILLSHEFFTRECLNKVYFF